MKSSEPPGAEVPDSWDEEGWARFGGRDYEAAVPRPRLTMAATVEPKPVEWLWRPRIPQGALVLLDGHPDTGKSTITLDLAARLSKGQRMPDGRPGSFGATLLLSTEDSLARPVKERLEAAGAELSMIYGLEVEDPGEMDARTLVFPHDAALLHHAIVQTNALLVVIDPIMGHIAGDLSANSDQDVRRALNPLVRIASATGATILMVRHLRAPERKTKEVPNFLEGGGSKGGFGIVRAGLVAMADADDPTLRTLHVTKANYGERGRPIDYIFVPSDVNAVARIRWLPR